MAKVTLAIWMCFFTLDSEINSKLLKFSGRGEPIHSYFQLWERKQKNKPLSHCAIGTFPLLSAVSPITGFLLNFPLLRDINKSVAKALQYHLSSNVL